VLAREERDVRVERNAFDRRTVERADDVGSV
jgi:hypothetical protein